MTKAIEKKLETDEIVALTSVMDELITKKLELSSQLKATEKEIEKIEFLMQEKLDLEKATIITCGYYSFGWETKQRTAFDQQKFKKEYPNLYENFKTTKETKAFKFGHRG